MSSGPLTLIYVAAILSKASIKPTHVEPKAGRIIASCDGAVKRNRKGERRRICTFLGRCGKNSDWIRCRKCGEKNSILLLFITKSDGFDFFHRF